MPTFSGTPGNDTQTTGFNELYGGAGNDRLASNDAGHIVIDGGSGTDFLFVWGIASVGEIYGRDGNDTAIGSVLGDQIFGGEGDDLVAGGDFNAPDPPGGVITPYTTSGNDLLHGDDGIDAVFGLDGDDVLFGGDGDDKGSVSILVPATFNSTDGTTLAVQAGVYGGEGNDTIYGGVGSDALYGKDGTDHLYGGAGADGFLFEDERDTPKGKARDVIFDFSRAQHDAIDLYYMDAKAKKSGDQAFKFIGKDGFHDKAGELRFDDHKLSGDTEGDGKADFEVKILGVNSLKVGDFYL